MKRGRTPKLSKVLDLRPSTSHPCISWGSLLLCVGQDSHRRKASKSKLWRPDFGAFAGASRA